MVDQAQSRIQEAMTSLVNEIDKSILRSMQRSMHLCAAKCCENEEASVNNVHKCIENCSTPLSQAQNFIQTELSQFQERLQRCVMVCQDKVKDKVTVSTTEVEAGVYKREFEDCAMQCVDEHISLLPSIRKRITKVLQKS
ncbi:hypothetical protein Anas_02093 [Armadillidium nasatum]|uniref:Protein FAM136A n=1 Tax=Armadillidium nasatum TaxID=96803 RepID=A0A5N5TMV4_9CRUS|nr:hypothetical protein Anas_02093 [Armadillidium nasatum]